MLLYVNKWRDVRATADSASSVVRRAARHVILSAGGCLVPNPSGPFLKCIHCHWVFDDCINEFRQLMEWFLDVGEFVKTDTAVSIARGDLPLDGRYFHLSFDDGFKNQLSNGVPVLRKLNIPALFFVTTNYVSSSYEEACDYSRRLDRSEVVKTLSWDDLQRMNRWGFEIGCHTRTHARLSDIDADDQLRKEVLGSKKMIEDRLGDACKYISWPFGAREDISEAAIELIRQSGYQACFGGFRGSIEPGKTDIFRLPRNHFEPHFPISHLRFLLRIY